MAKCQLKDLVLKEVVFVVKLPSRQLRYPTFGKGKSSSKVPWKGICPTIQVYSIQQEKGVQESEWLKESWAVSEEGQRSNRHFGVSGDVAGLLAG